VDFKPARKQNLDSAVDLSIVIVSWNTAQLLAQCLRAIYANPPAGKFEILVVDNASTDTSAQMVRKQFPQVNLFENEVNVGFARANNQAVRQSSGRYLLLLNPDTEVKPHMLEQLVNFMEAHAQAGAAGPCLLNPDGSMQMWSLPVPTPTLFREFWRLFHLDVIWSYSAYRTARWSLDQPQKVDTLLGACLLLRRTALDQIGLLDENYFIFSEEVDLCYRLQKANWHIYWLPQVQIVHYGGQSTKQIPTEMFVHLYESKVIFMRKHYGWPASYIYKFILLISALTRLLLSPLTWRESPSRLHWSLTLASRYWQLVRALPGM
jgi:GT2 family glycosyltransferase